MKISDQAGAMSPRLTLVVLGLMFFVPLTIAWLMYSGAIDYKPSSGVNHGELVEPPVPARLPEAYSSLGLIEHWSVVYPLPPECDDPCHELIIGLRQFHRALGRDAGRVRLVLLEGSMAAGSLAEEATKIYPEFNVISENTGMLLQQFSELADDGGIFVIDPLGNIMMNYPPRPDPNEILEDMERLLRYAKTDRRQG